MTFITSRISFGGYNFPSGFYVDSRQQDTTMDVVKLPYQDGAAIPPGTRSEKYIMVRGMIGGIGAVDSSGAYIQTSDQLENECNLMDSYLNAGYQQLSVGATPARVILCQKQKMKLTYVPGTGRTAANVEITFVAQDPRWLSTTQSTFASTSGTLTSNGSAFTWPTFNIFAASAGATITLKPAGALGAIELVLLNGTITSGGLVIVCDPRQRASAVELNSVVNLGLVDFVNSQNNVPDGNFFPYLNPGANLLSTSGISSMSTTWYDAYLF